MQQAGEDTFRPIPNPYIVGNPIEDRKMFFGREDDFEYIRKKVTGGKKGGLIVLCGTRRSGKTSILFQIKGGRLGGAFIPILIDMQSMTVESDGEFLAVLAREVIQAVGNPGVTYEGDFAPRAAANPFAAFQALTRKIGEKLGGKKIILLFDEYELFETHIDKKRFSTDILNLLASWVEREKGVFVIFTGSDKLESRNVRYWENFLGKALHRRISFLSKTDTMRLIHDPVKEYVQYDEGVAEEIYRLTAGQPFYTQVICQTVVDILNEQRKYRVSMDDIKQVVMEIIENPLPQMIFSWTSLSSLEKVSISIIAELSKSEVKEVTPGEIASFAADEGIGYKLDGNKVRETLERLFHHDLLNKTPGGEQYTFKMDLWRRWMGRMHSIWQVIDEISGAGNALDEGLRLAGKGLSRSMILGVSAVVITIAALLLVIPGTRQWIMQGGRGPQSDSPIALWTDSTTVTVLTEPAEATVFIDGVRIGKSPIDSKAVPVKRIMLRVELSGYREYTDIIDLEKDEPFEQRIVLEELLGALHITSNPGGAGIVLDEKDTGLATPQTMENLSANRLHSVDLRLAGYSSRAFPGIAVIADSTVEIHHSFSKLKHPLMIDSEPRGAEVFLDSAHKGITPMSLPAVTEGAHDLELRMAGYKTVRKRVSVSIDDNVVRETLVPLPPGVLEFRVHPYADIWINGELVKEGVPNAKISLAPGSYSIKLENPHFGSRTRDVQVMSGDTLVVDYDFSEEQKE